ncbi:MAG TPA: tetratricopeptide repeat protein [Opitutaceae bacterium]|nr:tetratricopeptide repeat protein [Opitutaceae bacterium]
MPATPAITPVKEIRLTAAVLALATLAAYSGTFSLPFIFDDVPAITQNAQIRDLSAWRAVLLPGAMHGAGVAGRPMINLSLALNHAISGERVWSYHLFNLLIHIASAITLFGLLRRTFQSPVLAARTGSAAVPLAGAAALIWALHPLLTESVTSVIQRTETVMGFFYLFTLYAFARSVESPAPLRWRVLAWIACLLGMASKEVMVSAPLLVLLYDRTFVAGTWAEACRRRWKFHLALAATWIPLLFLVLRSESRGGTAGFGHGVAWWEYALTQCRAIVLYLRLSLWPHPLVLDYGTDVVRGLGEVWPQILLLLALVAGTAMALWRRPVLGFAGAWFLAILAPSSSVVPLVTQTMAEHRMYLPLAAVVALGVGALHAALGRRCLALFLALAVPLGAATWVRNRDYRTPETIWQDTLAKRPGNERAYYSLAMIADDGGRTAEAVGYYETAVKLKPDYANAHSNLAHDLVLVGRTDEAIAHYREAGRLQPELADSHIHLGALYARLGRWDDARREYELVLRRLPKSGEDHFNLAQVDFQSDHLPEAIEHYQRAVELKPDFAEGHYRLGNAQMKAEQWEKAAAAYREAVRLNPQYYEAQINLGGVLLLLHRVDEAIAAYEQALRLRPGDALAQANLERARAGR